MIAVNCGVRQDGVLSPVLFAVYVNEKLSKFKHGCRIGEMFLECVMQSGDHPAMVDICTGELISIAIKLNYIVQKIAYLSVVKILTEWLLTHFR